MAKAENRVCGECTLCCQVVAAVQLRKATGEACQHVCSKGCGIYALRPQECRSFRCLWLNGYFLDSDRPDRLGVVFFEEAAGDTESLITVCESSFGSAADSPRAKELIRRILEMGLPVVLRNSKFVAKATPDGKVTRYLVDQDDPLKVRVVA